MRWTPVELPSYPDGPRPSSIVTLTGARHRGRGEHVGWTREAHERFAAAAATLPRGRLLLRDWVTAIAPLAPYDRAALEAAGIDLALRQHETTLFGLAGVAPRPLRWVVSFAAVFDPVTEAARHPGCELKIDVDPRWSDDVLGRLRALGRVAVLDWKMQGAPAEHERAHRHLPNAWIEDPRPGDAAWSPSLRARVVADAPVVSVDALAALPLRPAAVNVKPARMGGVLAALDCLGPLRRAGDRDVHRRHVRGRRRAHAAPGARRPRLRRRAERRRPAARPGAQRATGSTGSGGVRLGFACPAV